MLFCIPFSGFAEGVDLISMKKKEEAADRIAGEDGEDRLQHVTGYLGGGVDASDTLNLGSVLNSGTWCCCNLYY